MKKHRPITPGTRFRMPSEFEEITKDYPEKSLTRAKQRINGRNFSGRITMRHRGGGHKRRYRKIDFQRDKLGIVGNVAAIEYDPNRSARIALIHYVDGEKRYILCPSGLKVGQVILSGPGAEIKPGNALALKDIPVGEFIHNIEALPGSGGQYVRSAGGAAQLMAKIEDYALIRMPSGEQRRLLLACMATIGQVGNAEHANQMIGKAGANRWRGRRPRVRGVAMNPVDHPLGGGEGKSSGGRHPVSKWGQKSKGLKTRWNKRTDKFIVRRRERKS